VSSPPTIWRKDIIGWSLYDFANTIYSMNIVSRYLKLYIVDDLGYDDRFFDIPYSISMAIAALLLPALGAMSDHSTRKKIFLLLFTLTCCLAVGGMALVPVGAAMIIMLLFMVSNFAYEAGQPFYNALLYSVAEGNQARFVSGVGVALGYVGSVLGMILVLPFVTGSILGFDIPFMQGGGKTASFLPTAILFAVFAVPLFLWVRERPVVSPTKTSLADAYRDVWQAIRQTKRYPGVLRYLIADYFFEDAVATVIINISLYCTLVIGLDDSQTTSFLIISTITAVLGSLAIGKIAVHWPLKRMLNLIIIGWVVSLVLFVFVQSMTMVWILGSVVGILLGGLWTVTRPLLAELVPREELGRFFGLFSLTGRAAAVIGPLIWTATVYFCNPERSIGRAVVDLLGITGVEQEKLPYRMAVLSLVVMMLIGLYILRRVPEPKGNTSA